MKGIILAGGSGTRLYPITLAVSKQLMPVYDKPMIYYPLSTLIRAGISDLLIITAPRDRDAFEYLLGDGSQLGIDITYTTQASPRGLADAYILGADFIGNQNVTMILGDNLSYGSQLDSTLAQLAVSHQSGGHVFAYRVADPHRYGILELDAQGSVISVEEKPVNPKSNLAQTGLYVTDSTVVEIAQKLRTSARGELEVTDVMAHYLQINQLKATILERGSAWLDTGTFQSMNEAADFISAIEHRQGVKIGCIEEDAYRRGLIDAQQLEKLAQPLLKSGYGQYLLKVLED